MPKVRLTPGYGHAEPSEGRRLYRRADRAHLHPVTTRPAGPDLWPRDDVKERARMGLHGLRVEVAGDRQLRRRHLLKEQRREKEDCLSSLTRLREMHDRTDG